MHTFPPRGLLRSSELLLITDGLAAPADYLLYQLVSQILKDQTTSAARCIVLSTFQDLARWKAVSSKVVCEAH
jgi:hypothetical protein